MSEHKTAKPTGNEYETYVPKYSKSYWGYGPFLDRLGFRPKTIKVSRNVRDLFERDLKAYVCVPLTKHLRKDDNPAVFSALVLGFLKRYGTKYWGMKDREHLLEPNPSKGFLCPRDYERPGSYFLETVEALFNRRAVMFRYRDTDMAKRGKQSKILGLDFAAVKPEDLEDLVGGNDLEDTITLIAGLKRQAPDSLGSSDDGETANDAYGPETRSKKRKLMVKDTGETPPQPSTKRRGRKDASFGGSAGPSISDTAEPSEDVQAVPGALNSSRRREFNGENLETLTLRQLQRLVYNSSSSSTFKTPNKSEAIAEPTSTRRQRGKVGESSAVNPTPKPTPGSTSAAATPQIADFGGKVLLRVNATTQQNMAPVNVRLSKYNGRQSLLDFLGTECQLDPKSLKRILAVSVTCLWDRDSLRIRRTHVMDDWEVFCEKLTRTFAEDLEIAEKGCKVEMLLHVAE